METVLQQLRDNAIKELNLALELSLENPNASLSINNSLHPLNSRGTEFAPICVQLLSEELKQNKSLHTLELGMNMLGSTCMQHLAEALKVNNSLHTLLLLWGDIDSADAQHLAEALKVNNSLHTLILKLDNSDTYYSTNVRHISEALKVNKSLHVLHFQEESLAHTGAKYLAEALQQNDSLHTLNLMGNDIDSRGVQYLAEALKFNNSLQVLDLSLTDVDSLGVHHLADSLKINNSLQTLDLWGNDIDTTGTKHLAGALKVNCSLHTLNLGRNCIDSAEFQYLTEALMVNQSLHTLNLNENEIGSTGVQYLSKALKINKSLRTLTLGENQIDSKGAEHLAEALKQNNSLHTLNLEKNNIKSTGAQHLAEALKVNKSLRTLNLRSNGISLMFAQWILDALEVNKTLHTLHFTDMLPKCVSRLLNRNRQEFLSTENDRNCEIVHSTAPCCFANHHSKNQRKLSMDTSKQIVSQLRNLVQMKKKMEKNMKKTKLQLELAQLEDTLSPGYEINPRLAKMEHEVKQIQLQIEETLRNLIEMNQPALFDEAKQIVLDQNLAHNSPDALARFERKLMLEGKWMQRDLHGDYSNREVLDRHASIIEATTTSEQRVVLKKMSLSQDYLVRAAWNEISLLLKLQGRPSIIELNGAFLHCENGKKYTHIVMEMPLYGKNNLIHWLKGTSASSQKATDGRQLRSLPFSPSRDQESVLQLLLRIIESVGELHNLGIEHRDLKPENILVDSRGRHKLIDFGSSKDETLSFATTLPTRESSAYDPGTFTRYYAPPEKVNSSSTRGHRGEFGKWDVYSLGVIIYESLCSPGDWGQIETLCETQQEVKKVLRESGSFHGWIQDLVWRMLHRNASSRPSIAQVTFEIQQKLLDSLSDLNRRLRPKMKSAGNEFIESLHCSCERPGADSDISVRRNHIVEDVIAAFSQLKSREALLKQIRFKFQGEDESGHGSGVFREVCELVCAHLFQEANAADDSSQEQQLFVKDSSHDFFSPRDDVLLSNEMRAIGRFILHCMCRNTPLRLCLSPLVYCEMTKSVPHTLNGWLNIFRRFDSQAISNMNSYLHGTDTDNRQMAEDIIEEKKKALFGENHRKSNIQHLCEGFTEFMTQREKEKAELLNWDDMQLYCCGPEVVSLRTVKRCISRSLKDSRWKKNDDTEQTLKWFKKWLREQDNDGLRLFLRFITAQSSLPVELAGWKLTVLPCDEGIRAQTCSKMMEIGVDRKSEESFFRMMQIALEDTGKLED